MKKLFLLIVCFVLSIGARAQFSGSGSGTEEDPYRIYNDTHLAQMANFLNQEGVVFELMKDVDLTNYISENSPSQGWVPIGVESTPFKGILKGNGHKITGLFINRPSNGEVGLFGFITNSKISDVVLEGSKVTGETGAGSLVGHADNSELNECHVTLSSEEGVTCANGSTGGVIGFMAGGVAKNCSYIGNVTNTSGGAAGGFAFGLSGVTLSNIYVKGKITSTQGGLVGGLIGNCSGSNNISDITVLADVIAPNCFQVGGISGHQNGGTNYSNVRYEGNIEGKEQVGGIAGWISQASTFVNCHTRGRITASQDYVGGIVGRSDGGNIAKMESCSHFGDIEGRNYVGGLIGGAVKPSDSAEYIYISTSDISNTKTATASTINFVTGTDELIVNNCTAIGNITGSSYVGGLVGWDEKAFGCSNWSNGGTAIISASGTYYMYLWYGDLYTGSVIGTNYSSFHSWSPNFRITTIAYTNSYYSGTINGTDNVGGIAGCKWCGRIQNCYSNATVYGGNNTGGIIGNAEGYSKSTLTLKSNVAINNTISATVSNVGRIYGKKNDYLSIGALASQEGNRALTQTKVMLCGVAQDVVDDEQNGTGVGPSMLKLKANYVSWGWNFDDNWNILETECYPYKKYQAAPPVIESTLQSHDTSISGKSLNGGTVYMYYKDREAVSTECVGNSWQFATEELQSGAQVQMYADVEDMTPSYLTTATVKYPGSGTEEDPYRIYTAEDLQGASNSGYYKLMNDIDLTSWINENSPETGWPAIGRNSTAATYINGDGHKVTGLWINTTAGYNGLFSNYSAGYIKNLTVEVAEGKKVKGGDYTGILIGRMANGTIENCIVKGAVEGTNYVGGLAGFVRRSTMVNDSFDGSVVGSGSVAYIGGIAGKAMTVETTSSSVTATISGSSSRQLCIGGLYGQTELFGTTTSKSFANVTLVSSGEGETFAGGLVGYDTGDVISQCYSTGTIKVTSSESYTGGLVGVAETNRPIENCYSTANVEGTLYTAGLVGVSLTSIDKCYATGNVSGVMYGAGVVASLEGADASLTNSIAANNKLELSAQSSWGCRVIGGFKNGCAEPDASNYALNTMQVSLNGVPQKKTDDAIEGVSMTANELKSASTYSTLGWDMSSVWGINENNGYPVLKTVKSETPTTPEGGGDTPGGEPGGSDTPDAGNTDYSLSIAPITTTADSNINLSVCMSNKENINGFQFDIVLPQGMSIPKTSKGKFIINLGERGDDHTFSSSQRSDGSIRVVCTSLSNSIFDGNEGEICVIPVTLDNTLINGNYTVKLQNIALSDEQSSNILVADMTTEVKVINDYMTSADVSAMVGKTFELPLNLINKSTDICGFQFDVTMPEGISIAKNEKGKYMIALTERGDDHTFSALDRIGNSVRVVFSSLTNTEFDGTEGALCNLTFVSENGIADGTYDIKFSNIRLSNTKSVDIPVEDTKGTVTLKSFTPGDVNNDGIISVADVTAAISFVLEEPQSSFIREAADMDGNDEIMVNDVTAVISLVLADEGALASKSLNMKAKSLRASSTESSKLYIEPFSIEPGETKDINIMLDNPDLVSIGWQADLNLPEGLSFPLTKKGKYQTATVEDRTDGYSITSKLMSDGSVRVIGVSMENYEIDGTSGAIMTIKVTASADLAPGVYTANVKNIALSSVTSENKPLESTEYTVLSGNLSDTKEMTLAGGWTADAIDALNEKIEGNTALTSIDMSDAISIAPEQIEVANTNATVYVAEGMDVECNANVVKGGVCENFKLTDGNSFSAPVPFTAATTTYERTISGTWGTIILPYEVSSNDDVEYYIPTAVENNMLVLEKKDVLPANTPALVAKINGEKIQAKAQNVTVNATLPGAPASGSVTMYGTYENNTKIDNPDAYYIKNNQFLRCNGFFFVDAFRAYFTVSGTNARSLSIPGIGGETTAIEALLKDDNAKGVSYYDESGKQMNGLKSGVNIIRLSNGQVVKVKR